MGERLARLDLAGESEKHRPHRVVEPAVGDDHVEDRLGFRRYVLPNAERLEQAARGGDDRRGALVIGVALAEHRVDDGDGKSRPEPLPQGDRKRQAGKAAAGDENVDRTIRPVHDTHARTAGPISGPRPPGSIASSGKRANSPSPPASPAFPPDDRLGSFMSAIQDVLDILDLEPLEVNLFRGRSPQSKWQRVYGGQVIGQALVAACRTVAEVAQRPPHSLHAYFLLGGDPKVPIIYEVDRIRDGRSFTTRRVTAIQHGAAIFSMEVSFHGAEQGLSHQFPMPEVPKPDTLPSESEIRQRMLSRMPDPVRTYYQRERPIEMRAVEYGRYLGEKVEGDGFHVWIRATGSLPDEPAIHQCVLAYASDMSLLGAALIPHRPQHLQQRDHGGKPRPRDVVPPAVPRR